jgi:hypothetical protein
VNGSKGPILDIYDDDDDDDMRERSMMSLFIPLGSGKQKT